MGRGKCVISDKDLVILELLYREKDIRLVSIADKLNTKIPVIKDNLIRLQRLGLIDRKAKIEKSGVGSYYHITEQGKILYNILRVGANRYDDVIDRFLEDIKDIEKLYDCIKENKNSIIVFNSNDYNHKEFIIEAYEELKRKNGYQLIAYTKGVREDTLRIGDDKEWHDLMISYITEYGNTKCLVNAPFNDIITMVKDKLGFKDPIIFIKEMIRLRHAIIRYNPNLSLPFVLGSDTFVVIGFEDKGLFTTNKEIMDAVEEYYKTIWRDSIEFKELDDYLINDEEYIGECIANYIEGTAYATDNKLLYDIAERLKKADKIVIKEADKDIIDAYREIKDKGYIQYVIINKDKKLDISIDYAISIGNSKILTNDDSIAIDARVIDEPLISVAISNNFVIIPYRDRCIFSRDPILIDLLKEYFLTLWSKASTDFRKMSNEELDKLIDAARTRLKSIGVV